MLAAPSHLLYLHGFRSSPQSTKAQLFARWLTANRPDVVLWCPQLPPSPRMAMDMVLSGVATWPHEAMAVVGSSLGGFYAGVVAERTICRAVVLNPAVDPARDLSKHIGEQTTWQNPAEHFYFRPEYVDELRAMTPARLTHLLVEMNLNLSACEFVVFDEADRYGVGIGCGFGWYGVGCWGYVGACEFVVVRRGR